MIEGWWKLIVPDTRNVPGKSPELYNLRDDPWEKNDLASQETSRVKKLTKELDVW